MSGDVIEAALDFLHAPVGIPQSWRGLDANGAQALLGELSRHEAFVGQALERGTPAAEARLWLNARASGVVIEGDALRRLAGGVQDVTPQHFGAAR